MLLLLEINFGTLTRLYLIFSWLLTTKPSHYENCVYILSFLYILHFQSCVLWILNGREVSTVLTHLVWNSQLTPKCWQVQLLLFSDFERNFCFRRRCKPCIRPRNCLIPRRNQSSLEERIIINEVCLSQVWVDDEKGSWQFVNW